MLSHHQRLPRPPHQKTLAILVLLCAALQFTPVLAAELTDPIPYNATSTTQDSIKWMSGGVGDEARDAMRQAAANYNVHIVFSSRQGAYLANVPFTVSKRNGEEIYSGVSEGPLLYLKLPAGSYQIAAKIDETWQHKRIQTGSATPTTRLSFVSKFD